MKKEDFIIFPEYFKYKIVNSDDILKSEISKFINSYDSNSYFTLNINSNKIFFYNNIGTFTSFHYNILENKVEELYNYENNRLYKNIGTKQFQDIIEKYKKSYKENKKIFDDYQKILYPTYKYIKYAFYSGEEHKIVYMNPKNITLENNRYSLDTINIKQLIKKIIKGEIAVEKVYLENLPKLMQIKNREENLKNIFKLI